MPESRAALRNVPSPTVLGASDGKTRRPKRKADACLLLLAMQQLFLPDECYERREAFVHLEDAESNSGYC